MGRSGKVVIERIRDESKRKTTEKKRTEGLVSKAMQLSKMCEAETVVVIYSPGEKEPTTIWPKEEGVARATLSKFLAEPESLRLPRSENAKSFLVTRNKKLEEKLHNLKMKNEDAKIQLLLTKLTDGTLGFHEVCEEDKELLGRYLDNMTGKLIARMNKIAENENMEVEGNSDPAAAVETINADGGGNIPRPSAPAVEFELLIDICGDVPNLANPKSITIADGGGNIPRPSAITAPAAEFELLMDICGDVPNLAPHLEMNIGGGMIMSAAVPERVSVPPPLPTPVAVPPPQLSLEQLQGVSLVEEHIQNAPPLADPDQQIQDYVPPLADDEQPQDVQSTVAPMSFGGYADDCELPPHLFTGEH